MAYVKINEGSRLPLTTRFVDSTGGAIIPVTLRYKLDCKTTGRELLGWTIATPTSSLVYTIPASLNVLQNQGNAFELKTFTVEANYGTDDQFTSAYTYQVQNLQALS
jgi:hypothetical protein